MPVAAIAMIADAGVLEERHGGQHRDHDAGPDRGVQAGRHPGSGLENGSWLSRAMPKPSRMVAARIDRQQTKIAAETTSR